MQIRLRFYSPPSTCAYLPDRQARFDNELVAEMTAAEYFERMRQGWRRFGHVLFRPRCSGCRACQSLRVDVARFRPSRSQRRNRKLNENAVHLIVRRPEVTAEKLELYDRYHAFQAEYKDWPAHPPKDAAEYCSSFVEHPFPTEEWCYQIDDRLVGVGYVDRLPGGLSAIYFFYEPTDRGRGLGVWNVLSVIDRAREMGLPHVYLGYFVEGCESMIYKADFEPNQLLGPDGVWHEFRG